jgi:hypothetical protein
MISIVIPEDKTKYLNVDKHVDYAVVLLHTVYVSGHVVRGVALHGCHERAFFEMTEQEFLNLNFDA